MKFSLIAAAALATVAYAQDLGGLSSQCTVQVGLLVVGDLGQCLAVTQLIGIFNNNSPIVDSLGNYLNSLCDSDTPRCSNSTLESASNTIESACQQDLESTGDAATALNVLDTVFESYPEFYTAACSRNETTNEYCVISTLEAVQNATGQTLDASYVSQLLGGSSEGLSELNEALDDGQLCTDCVAGFYRQAIAANASVTNIPAVSSIAARCGDGFGTTTQETGVSSSPLPSSTGGASSGASSSSAAATNSPNAAGVLAAPFGSIAAAGVVAFVAVAGGVLAGGAAVL